MEPWRAASSEEDCKARVKQEGHVSGDSDRDRDREEREENEGERKRKREVVNQQELGTSGAFARRSLGGNTVECLSLGEVVCLCV